MTRGDHLEGTRLLLVLIGEGSGEQVTGVPRACRHQDARVSSGGDLGRSAARPPAWEAAAPVVEHAAAQPHPKPVRLETLTAKSSKLVQWQLPTNEFDMLFFQRFLCPSMQQL